MQAGPFSERPTGRSGGLWCRAGAGALLGLAMVALAAMGGQPQEAAAWPAPPADGQASRTFAASPGRVLPALTGLTALDRGEDDLVRVYRALNLGG